MGIIETLNESIDVLKTNKMRTTLSVLGIIIGIGSVIALITLGEASQYNIKKQIQALGTNLITIRPGSQQQGFLRSGPSDSTTLSLSDMEAIKSSDRITTVSNAGADYTSRAQVSYGRNNSNVQIYGITDGYFSIRNISLAYGEYFSQANYSNKEKVAILGPTILEELFGADINPIGMSININGSNFKVIGVTKSKGGAGLMNMDDAIYIPILTSQKVLFGVNHISTIYVNAKDDNLMDPAKNQVGFLLLELHKKTSPDDADFSISSQEDLLETITEISNTFTTLLTGIAAISLVVGGIGIMNIMLVTVTERTAEIGLRKALGAKRKSIIRQFLIESIILTITGGVIGIFLGLTASYAITKFMSLPLVISYKAIVLSVLVSTIIGIIFGIYPARRAAKLQPIEALRYE